VGVGVVGGRVSVLENGGTDGCEAEAVDEAGVVEGVAEDEVGWFEEGGQDADVELIAAGEEDRVVCLDEACETTLDVAVLGEVAADESGGSRTGGDGSVWRRRRCGRGKTEVVVAAEADARTAVEVVGNVATVGDRRRATGHSSAGEVTKARAEAVVEGCGHGRGE